MVFVTIDRIFKIHHVETICLIQKQASYNGQFFFSFVQGKLVFFFSRIIIQHYTIVFNTKQISLDEEAKQDTSTELWFFIINKRNRNLPRRCFLFDNEHNLFLTSEVNRNYCYLLSFEIRKSQQKINNKEKATFLE